MKNCILLAKGNINKSRKQTISLVLVIMFASLLLNIGLSVNFDYANCYEQKCEELNSANAIVVESVMDVDDTDASELYEYLKNHQDISDIECRDALFFTGCAFDFAGNEVTSQVIAFNEGDDYEIGKLKYTERSDREEDNWIELPLIINTGGGYQIGDEIVLGFGSDEEETFVIRGFYEEMMTGSSVTLSCIIDQSYNEKLSDYATVMESNVYSLKFNPDKDEAEIANDISKYMADEETTAGCRMVRDTEVRRSRCWLADVVCVVVICFAAIIVLISLVVVKFRIGNSIQENVKNIGALKAMGYTSAQIKGGFIVQFVLVGLCGSTLGIILSCVLLPGFSVLLSSNTGMLWDGWFNLATIMITLVAIVAALIVDVLLATGSIRTLHPVNAIRGTLKNSKIKRNHLPIEKTVGGVNYLLAMKNALQNGTQNIIILFIVALLSFALCFASIMFYNSVVDPSMLIEADMGQLCDVYVQESFYENSEDSIIHEIEQMDDVEQAFHFWYFDFTCEDYITKSFVTKDYTDIDNKMCYEGRLPETSNEIGLSGVLARRFGKTIGEEVECSVDSETYTYKITSLVQFANNGTGEECCLTEAGYVRLTDSYKPSIIYINLKDGVDEDAFIEKMEDAFDNKILTSINYTEQMDTLASQVVGVLGGVCIVIAVVSLFIIALVLVFIINVVIARKRTYFGILKAVGYTGRQLNAQLALSYVPTILVGIIVGAVISLFYTNPLIAVLLSGVGIMKIAFIIPVVPIIFVCIAFFALSLTVVYIISGKVRKVPVSVLVTE